MPDADHQAPPALITLVEQTLRELQAGRPGLPAVTPESRLDQDLGLDSLARMELLVRVERAFGTELPEDTLQNADTVADLQAALLRGRRQSGAAATVPQPSQRPLPTDAPPAEAAQALPLAAASTLVDALERHVRLHGSRVQHVVLHDQGEQQVSYAELLDSARAVAASLQQIGVVPRQCVAIMLPTSAAYFAVYFGVLIAGAVPVPIYPPARASQLEDHVLRHAGILRSAAAVALITVPEALAVAQLLRAQVPGLRRVIDAADLLRGGASAPVVLRGDDIAFIQYTSGSTGTPKGVALTHDNLLANIRAMAQAVQASERDVFVSWLPLYHDMGLIGAWLAAVVVGFPLVVMSPLAFLARPQRWLQAIHRWRGTLSAGPNFAYELCLRRIDDAELAGLDLSCWRLAFNGAEAVSPDTLRRFSERFARCGLRPEAMTPVYGLAECSLGLLFPPRPRVAVIDAVQREPLARERLALPAPTDDPSALHFVVCGQPLPGHQVRIVDDQGQEVGERTEGRLEFKGPSATRGYYRDPARTALLIHDGWLDSGDRAYRADGEVVITGRVKDIVIRGGRNLHPTEIEEAVGEVEGIRRGCVAVFGNPDPATGTERLVVMAETKTLSSAARIALHEAVSRAVIAAIGEPPDEVALVPPHTVLKTSSGKVRRSACRERWLSGGAERGRPAVATQVVRLLLLGLRWRATASMQALARALWGAWCGLLFFAIAPLAGVPALLVGQPARAWALSGRVARVWLRGSGLTLQVSGLERLPAGACVLMANHASYTDGALLVAALPRAFSFVAKRELQRQFFAGNYLRALGTLFVERSERQRSVADAERLAEAVAKGASLAVFPEGTFVAAPGLLPFHLGGFLAAARAGVPVVPVAITGSRGLLGGDRWWPRRARLAVEVLQPVMPPREGDLFAGAVAMREATRAALERALARQE